MKTAWAISALLIGWVQMVQPVAGFAAPPQDDLRRLDADGFEHFYNLEYDEAIAAFQKLRDADPVNPTWHNQLAAAYFYKQLYQAGVMHAQLFNSTNRFFQTKKIQVDPEVAKNFWAAFEAATGLCERRLKENEKDEEALYACGVAYSSKAVYEGLIERSKLAFLDAARRANNYHARLIAVSPRTYDAYLIPGLYDFILGSLPGPVKFLLYFTGLSGDKQRGIQAIESVAKWGDQARENAKIILVVLYNREKRRGEAIRVLQELAGAFPRNYVLPLEIASIRKAAGEEEEAIRQFEQVLEAIRRDAPGYHRAPAARVHFELAELYRQEDDLESARTHLKRVPGSRGTTPEMDKESETLLRQIEETLQMRNRADSEGSESDAAFSTAIAAP